jgi:hypothetical protein
MLPLLLVVPVGVGIAIGMINKAILAAILRLPRMEWICVPALIANIDHTLIP